MAHGRERTDSQRSLCRSRWAAIGAAVAVSLGGGGLFVAQAASSPASSVVTIDPVRILDTRTNVGLSGPFESLTSRKLQVTGAAVPAGATGVLLNVTVVAPTAAGFLSVRPGDATGAPSTSSLNFTAGDIVPNSVQVGLPTSGANTGRIDITYDAFGLPGPTTNVLIDAVGYMIEGGGGATGPAGPAGPAGKTGPAGATGVQGVPGPGYDLENVVWVAKSGGDFTSLSAALASITDATRSKPYVIKIAPGVYTEPSRVSLKSFVDVQGSGQDITVITCACSSVNQGNQDGATLLLVANSMEVRDLTVENTGGGNHSVAIGTALAGPLARFTDVTAHAFGSVNNYGVYNTSSSPTMTNVTATATFDVENPPTPDTSVANFGVYNSGSSPTMTNVTATASAATGNYGVWNTTSSSPTMTNVTITADAVTFGGDEGIGVYNALGSSGVIRDSFITGSDFSVERDDGSLLVFDTKLDGDTLGMTSTPGQTNSCYNVFTTELTPFTCDAR